MVQLTTETANDKPNSLSLSGQPVADFDRDAAIVTEMTTPGTLSVVVGKTLQERVRPAGYKVYRDQLLKASGSPTDPLVVMLLEQAAVAHHRILDLHAQAAKVDSPEMIEVLNVAATKLLAEFRRLCLAVREYRSPVVAKNVTMVKQQNVAAGDQRIAMVEQNALNAPQEKSA